MKSRETNDRGRVKLRLVEVEVEGNSHAILEGLRSVTAALTRETPRPINGGTQHRVLSSHAGAVVAPPAQNGELFPEAADTQMPDSDADAMIDPGGAEGAGDVSKPKGKRYFPSCKLLPIDVDKGSPSLRVFADGKQPDSVKERYMVCAAWLKKEHGTTAITNDHIHTCFIGLGWKAPEDISAAFRKMKNKQFKQNGSERELHSNGDQLVARLPLRD